MSNNNNNHCKEYEELIMDEFDYLFLDLNFRLDHISSHQGGEKCLLVYRNPSFSVRFFFDRGTVEVSIGGAEAPADQWYPKTGPDLWFPLEAVIRHINETPKLSPEENQIEGVRIFKMSTSDRVSEISDQLCSIIDEIRELFSKPGEENRLAVLRESLPNMD